MANPYQKFLEEELILRDHLAIDRTKLANERTFLAYIRTAIGIAVAGGTLLKFVDGFYYHAAGVILVMVGVLTLIIGYLRYQTTKNVIRFDLKKNH